MSGNDMREIAAAAAAAAATPATPALPPSSRGVVAGEVVAGRFEIRRQLGRGGFGVVYEAYDRKRRAFVALKSLRDVDAEGLYRFKREFRSLAEVAHENLVALDELFADGDDRWFFTMELVDGVPFSTWVTGEPAAADPPTEDRTATMAPLPAGALPPPPAAPEITGVMSASLLPPLTSSSSSSSSSPPPPQSDPRVPWSPPREPRARRFDELRLRAALAQLAAAVAALHAAGKLHRDLKPQNVLVTADGRLKVLDFGLVAELGRRGSSDETVEVAGTPAYVAPEQVRGDPPTPAADWYSVGAMLYEVLAGQAPFGDKTGPAILVEKLIDDPPPPSALALGVPPDLEALAMKLLSRAPEKRPSEAEIFTAVTASSAPSAPATPPRDDGRPPATTPSRGVRTPTHPALADAGAGFVGRVAELARLRAAFAARAQGAVVVLVEGESGIGKSALVRRFLEEVQQQEEQQQSPPQRAVVLAGRCFERESVPFKALDGIVDALSRHLQRAGDVEAARVLPGDREVTLLARIFPVLRRVSTIARSEIAVFDAGERSAADLRESAFGALRELFVRLADRQPLVLFVDDLQWADADSLALIAELVRPPRAPRLLLVATCRERAIALPGDVVRIAVGALSRQEAAALVAKQRPNVAADEGAALVGEAAGHPLFLLELAQHQGASAASSLDAVLGERVEALPDDARRLLEVLSLAGAPMPLLVAAEAAELSPSSCARLATQMRAARLVRTGPATAHAADALEPYHDRIRASVSARCDDERKKETHRTLATALENAGAAHDDPQALVRHLEAAGELSRAAEYARIAGERAQEMLAFERAVELFDRSAALFQRAGVLRFDVVIRLGEALQRAGELSRAAACYVRAAAGLDAGDGGDAERAFDLRRRAVQCYLSAGELDRGQELLGVLVKTVDVPYPRDDYVELGRSLLDLGRARLFPPRPREVDAASVSLAVRRKAAVCQAIGQGFFLLRPAFGNSAWRVLVRLLREPCDAHVLALERVFRATMKSALGAKQEELDRELRIVVALTEKIADRAERQWISDRCVLALILSSRYRDALQWQERGLSEAASPAQASSWSHENIDARIWRVVCLDRLGRFRDLASEVPQLTREADRRGNHLAQLFFSSGYASGGWLAADKPDEARRALQEALRHFDLEHVPYLRIYELQTLVRAAAYEGNAAARFDDLDRAYETLSHDPALKLSRGANANFLHTRAALVAAALAEDPRGPRRDAWLLQLTRLSAALQKQKLPLGDAHAAVARAAAAAVTGDAARAARLLDGAVPLFEALDMAGYVAAARRALGLVRGDRALVGSADAALSSSGAAAPEKMARVLVPGF